MILIIYCIWLDLHKVRYTVTPKPQNGNLDNIYFTKFDRGPSDTKYTFLEHMFAPAV